MRYYGLILRSPIASHPLGIAVKLFSTYPYAILSGHARCDTAGQYPGYTSRYD